MRIGFGCAGELKAASAVERMRNIALRERRVIGAVSYSCSIR